MRGARSIPHFWVSGSRLSAIPIRMSVARHERARDDLVSLAHRGHDVGEFSLGAARVLGRAVGFDGFCLLTFDPATLMPTGEVVKDGLPEKATPRLAEIEVAETDFNNFRELAHAELPAATLSAATEGDLDRSLRHRELRGPGGFGDELRVTLVAEDATWGAITLLRAARSSGLHRGRRTTDGGVRSLPGPGPEASDRAAGARRRRRRRPNRRPESSSSARATRCSARNDAGRALLEELMTVTKPGRGGERGARSRGRASPSGRRGRGGRRRLGPGAGPVRALAASPGVAPRRRKRGLSSSSWSP